MLWAIGCQGYSGDTELARQHDSGKNLSSAMNMETEKGTETLIDYQSYSAGYRQAVCDLITPEPTPETRESFPWLFVGLFFATLALIKILENVQ